MTIEAAIANLAAKALAVPGVKSAPALPPEAPGEFPFAVTFERSGELQLRSAGWADDLAVIYVEFHVARQLLPTAVEAAMALRDPFLGALINDPTLGGAVSTVVGVTRTFGQMEYGGTRTVGYRFEVRVKVEITP